MSKQENSYRSDSNSNIQYFIDHEKSVLSEERAAVRARSDFRELRCFCGCTNLTREQIENFSMMSVSGLITHEAGSRLFRNFLRIGHLRDKSEAMILLECHDVCKKILANLQLVYEKDTVDQLLNLCPTFDFEQRLSEAFQSGQDQKIVQILQALQHECVRNVECHNDYDRFRRRLLAKIGKP